MRTTATFEDDDGSKASVTIETAKGQPSVRTLDLGSNPNSQANELASTYHGMPDAILSTKPLPPEAPEPAPEGGVDPADVTVLVNNSVVESMGMALAYCTAHGIPQGNITTADLGTADVLTNKDALDAARAAISAAGREITVCAFRAPFAYRVVSSDGNSAMSITSALSYGADNRKVTDLKTTPLYGNFTLKPYTDFGVRPAFLLVKERYITTVDDKDGTSILLLAKDQSGYPRGNARSGQNAKDLTVWDSRSASNIGNGENACNNISPSCWVAGRTPVPPIMAYYGSMPKLGYDAGVNWVRGFYGDHVTSFGGFIDQVDDQYTNSKQQTSILWHLERGACMSSGSVSEPWQGGGTSPGALTEQFCNVSIFDPLFRSGKPVGPAIAASVKCPDRILFAGDPLAMPCRSEGGVVDPPGPTPGVIREFTNFSNTDRNFSEVVGWKGVKRFRFVNLKLLVAPNYQRLCHRDDADKSRGLRIDNTGKWKWDTLSMPVVDPPTLQAGVLYSEVNIRLSAATDVKYFLAYPGVGSALQFECDLLQVLDS